MREVETLLSLWDRAAAADQRLVDGAIAVVLTVLTQVEIGRSDSAGRAALLLTLSLAFRRRWPLAVASIGAVGVALQGLSDNPPSAFGEYVALTLAVYTAAAYEPLTRAVLALVLMVAGIVFHDLNSAEYGSASGMASDLTIPIVFWVVGRAVRYSRRRTTRAVDEARRSREQGAEMAREAVAEERRHIARELHDVVTHSLGVVVLQAQGARRVLDDGREPVVSGALETIEASGRTALEEMRRLLGLLREDDDRAGLLPQPRLSDLPALVARVQASGLDVRMSTEGAPEPLPPGIELSVYRVVQEALTNTLKHASASSATVTVRYLPFTLEVQVEDDGIGGSGGGEGSRRGLAGMEERVGFFGGTLDYGPRPGCGFGVRARFPVAESG